MYLDYLEIQIDIFIKHIRFNSFDDIKFLKSILIYVKL